MEKTCNYQLNFSKKVYRCFKMIMDFLIALITFIVFLPLFIIVAIAIKIDSKGPIFFVQKRIGKKGKLFNCIKFRSMSIDTPHDVAGYECDNIELGITKVGAFLRKYSIDELPQLFNILTFKMSFIGYRPSQTCEITLNSEREKYDLYQIVPGISGWAQVNGRDILAANPKEKAEFDAYYLQHFSLWLDIKIFFMTILKVFKSEDIVEGVIKETEKNMEDAQEYNEIVAEIAVGDFDENFNQDCDNQVDIS